MNAILEITHHGQSIWFDYIQRGLIWTGALHKMAREEGLRGVTSNPAIFEKAIGGSRDYDAAVRAAVKAGLGPMGVFERVAMEDIQLAADVLREVYDKTNRQDGYVSFEVAPNLANDTAGTVAYAERVWAAIDRENLMVKIPATPEGVPAIEACIAAGLNINVTLLFAVEAYEAVAEAYMAGLERLVAKGGDPSKVASVASFFVSRIDTLVDKQIDERLPSASKEQKEKLERLRGKVAIANAKIAYASYQRMMASDRWKKLAAKGARPQRLLWASTGTKNPAYRDVVYVEELIGPDTVNTVPEATYNAFKDHGKVRDSLLEDLDGARAVMSDLASVDLSMKAVTDKLLVEGVVLFADAFDRLLATVEKRRRDILGGALASMSLHAPELAEPLKMRLESLRGFPRRLFQRDASLWVKDGAAAKATSALMGWLDVPSRMREHVGTLEALRRSVVRDGFEHVVFVGMGGAVLGAEVFAKTFGRQPGAPDLHVLDTIAPGAVASLEKKVRLDRTLFVVASKSGTTAETAMLERYFFDRVKRGDQFVAITDPGSRLEKLARDRGFRAIVEGEVEIGGRYSALSPFGLTALALMGVDVRDVLGRAERMVFSSGPELSPVENPGVRLGALLGELALSGRDKLTLVTSPALAALGPWVEELVATSTGKQGKGIVPVAGEVLGAPGVYGKDRVFVRFALKGEAEDPRLAALEAAGHPVVRLTLEDRRDVVQEMYRWEIAVATASHVLGVNPFDQPNVQETKDYTASLLAIYGRTGVLPEIVGQVRVAESDELTVYTDERSAKELGRRGTSIRDVIGAHLGRLAPGDYVAITAFVEPSAQNAESIEALRTKLRDARHVATTVGYGPRFLHSTGQLHKGGANNGLFLQLTADESADLAIPGEKATFDVLTTAQEGGDFLALSKRERRVVRVHLGQDVQAGLRALLGLVG